MKNPPWNKSPSKLNQALADTERQHAALEAVIRTAYAPVTYTLKIAPL